MNQRAKGGCGVCQSSSTGIGHEGKGGLSLGKLPPEVLRKYLLGMTGAVSSSLLVPPSLGVDFGVVRDEDSGANLIVSSDPITGASDRVGWYAINVSANDVATSGSRPRYIQSVILLPQGSGVGLIARIARQMSTTAAALGITIVGGHTELTPGLKRPIVATTAFAFTKRFVTAADACDGDTIMLTKTAGVEGTAILAADYRARLAKTGKMSSHSIGRAAGYFKRLSVVDEAVAAFATGKVTAMHDCTEGGVLGAVYEMSVASGLGFELDASRVPVGEETRAICKILGIDPLRLISSGTLLLSVQPGGEKKVAEAINAAGSVVTEVGRFRRGQRVLLNAGGLDSDVEVIKTAPIDEIWRLAGEGGHEAKKEPQSRSRRPRSPRRSNA